MLRNESKFKKRGVGLCCVEALEYKILRPSIVQLMVNAITLLQNPKGSVNGEDKFYLEKNIPGLGVLCCVVFRVLYLYRRFVVLSLSQFFCFNSYLRF